MSGFTRRSFFKIVATSGAAVAAGGCNDVNELVGNIPQKLIPYVVPPDNIVPGVAAYFSTVCRECPAGCGLVAKNRDGRVIKLEGNPDHPVNAGALCIRGQAALQGLYHPDRYRGALVAGKSVAWDEAEKGLADKLQGLVKAKQGSKIALVTGLETGSLGRLMDEWTKALGARPRITYEPLGYEALRAANRATFGRDSIPYYAIEDADYLVSFGADFLETWGSNVGNTSAFTKMHALGRGKAGTFVAVEPRQSMTAGNADEWLRSAPGTEGVVALAMLKVILEAGHAGKGADAGSLGAAVKNVDLAKAAEVSGVPADTITRIAHAFAGHRRLHRGQPSQPGRGRGRPDHTLRRRCGAGEGEPLLGDGEAHEGDGRGGDRRPHPRRRESCVRHAAQGRIRGGARQGADRGEPRHPTHRDVRSGRAPSARAPSSRVVG